LVLTADLSRVAAVYGPSAYHLVHLDAGVAVAQCSVVAAGFGLATIPAIRWNDELIGRALMLDPEDEPVTAVLGLSLEVP